MPDLDFKVLGVDAAARGLAPLLHFKIEIVNQTPGEKIQSVMLHAQIQIQSPQRAYTASEKEKLRELFGRPEDWGQTLRNKLLAHANCIVPGFADRTEAVLVVPCTFDLNVAATKYFYALEDGEVPLLFLFSGTVFYSDADGRLQIQQISWEKEAAWRMPIGGVARNDGSPLPEHRFHVARTRCVRPALRIQTPPRFRYVGTGDGTPAGARKWGTTVTNASDFWGAHAARVHVSAASPKHFLRIASLTEDQKKVRKGEGAFASTRGACAPQSCANITSRS